MLTRMEQIINKTNLDDVASFSVALTKHTGQRRSDIGVEEVNEHVIYETPTPLYLTKQTRQLPNFCRCSSGSLQSPSFVDVI